MPSLISQLLLPCLKTRRVWEGGWPWFDSPGRMELCSLLSWIHSNVTAHICTHKAHTRTHARTSTIYVCEDEMRRKEKGCSCCLDSKIEVATQQWSLKSFVFKIYRVTHKTVGETGSGRRDSDTLYCLNILLAQFEIKLFFSFFPVVVVVTLYKYVVGASISFTSC